MPKRFLLAAAAGGCCLLILAAADAAAQSNAAAQTNITVRANNQRSVGGVGTLNRARYFNHWGTHVPPTNTNLGNLAEAVWREDELNSVTGRETFEFDAFSSGVPEDPNRPGFYSRSGLAAAFGGGAYRNWVLNGQRWESLRVQENPVFVQSGRANGAWSDFIKAGTPLPIANNGASYAEVLNVYLEEVVYGTGPGQGYLPFNKDGFHVEIVNEPQWEGVPWQDVITMHRTVTELVKEAHPQASIGGVSCCTSINGNPLNSWPRMEQIMQDMVNWRTASGERAEFDFWSIHPYERYSVLADGSHVKDVHLSPGHLESVLDLYESRSNQLFGDPKAFAVTEYGSWNRTTLPNQDYGDYSRAEQQWDLVRDIREKLMVFLDRPDRIINATPFVAPQWFTGNTPTDPDGDPVFWERDADGNWRETIVAGMYRLYNDLSGRYVPVETDNPDLQTHAFRDGNQLYVVLNNLEATANSVSLAALTGGAAVSSASLDRVFWNGSVGVYEEGVDVTANWRNLLLQAEEGAVLTLTLDGPQRYDYAIDERTYYGDAVLTPVGAQGITPTINIQAELEDAVAATARVSFHREAAALSEHLRLFVNGQQIFMPGEEFAFDEGDRDMVTREIEVPLELLIDGDNELYVDFIGAHGQLVSAVLLIDHSIGDFNDSGVFDGGDLALLRENFGAADPGSEFDLVEDGVVDEADVAHWLTELRGDDFSLLGDFNRDSVVSAADFVVWRDSLGADDEQAIGGNGDSFAGVDPLDYDLWASGFGGGQGSAAAANVPEPSAALSLWIGLAAACGWRRAGGATR